MDNPSLCSGILSSSNKTSVITKSVAHMQPLELHTSTEQYQSKSKSLRPASVVSYCNLQTSPMVPVSPSSPNETYYSSSPSDHALYSYYDIYSEFDLSKNKRKPIPVPIENKDDAYWERRRRNNESAKRSREIRRLKEVQTTKRIIYLEQENVKLQAEVKFLREEIKRLRDNEILPYLVRTSIK